MSIGGPSPLGTLLVQRLDAVLGTTLSQQANLVSGARPDAVSQASSPEQANAARNETLRHPRETVDRATAQTEQQGRQAVDKGKVDAKAAELLQARNAPSTAFTRSAPTTLGHAARTILALLTQFGDQPAVVQGKRPLLSSQAALALAARSTGMAGNTGVADTLEQSSARGAGSRAGQGAQAGTSTVGSASAGASGTGDSATNGGARALAGGPASGGAPGPDGSAAAATGRVTGGATPTPGSSAAGGAAAAGTISQAPAGSVAGQLAQALSQSLQYSGIFYESHLVQLATGRMTVQQLMLEPQATAGRASADGSAPQQEARNEQAVSRTGEPANAGAATRAGEAAQAPTGANPSALSGLDPNTHLLVRQQLEVLANQSFAWRGEAWPDAPLEWEVSRREESAEGQEDNVNWATRIAIQLPRLGQVEARLSLSGGQVVMHVVAPDSAAVLDEHVAGLRSRYTAQGLVLSQLSIAAATSDEASMTANAFSGAHDAGETT